MVIASHPSLVLTFRCLAWFFCVEEKSVQVEAPAHDNEIHLISAVRFLVLLPAALGTLVVGSLGLPRNVPAS
jgi:hypothetical protein